MGDEDIQRTLETGILQRVRAECRAAPLMARVVEAAIHVQGATTRRCSTRR